MKQEEFKIKDHKTTIFRRLVQIFAFLLINLVILELIFSISLWSLDGFLGILPILNSPRNPLSRGAGLLEYLFFFILESTFPLFLIGVLIIVLLFTNRFFCGWICPIGTIQDACAAIPTEKKKVKPNTNKFLLKIKYGFLTALIILLTPLIFLKATNYTFYLNFRDNLGDFSKKPLAYFSLSEYIFVFFPNMIKDIFETGSFDPLFENFLVFFVFFFYIIIMVLSVWYPRIYCRYLCPFGAAASLIGEFSFLKLSRSPVRCIGRSECGICEKKCPKQIRILDEPYEFFGGGGECNLCMKCKESCPYDAIKLKFL